MTAADLVGALTPVAEALEALGVAYYISGSLASSIHGVARASLDVDVVADLRAEHADPFADALGDAYYFDRDRIRWAIGSRRSFNVIHLRTMFKVDVFVSRARPFDEAAFRRIQVQTLEDAPGARSFPIGSAEDITLAKLEWFKAGSETSERQWNDVVGMIKARESDLDIDYLNRSAAALGLGELLKRAMTDAALPPRRRDSSI